MNLIIDAGNTRIKLAVFDPVNLVHVRIIPEWSAVVVESVCTQFTDLQAAITCAVRSVPDWLPQTLASRGIDLVDLTYQSKLPVKLLYGSPETLGRDRIAGAAGAAALHPGKPVVVVDAGTALTIDLVTADGEFIGGNISPGINMRFAALNNYTFNLPLVAPEEEVPLLGQNTREAILAGVINGITYEIDNSINSLKNKYNDLRVILTGGDAEYLSKRLKNTIFVSENLILLGLNIILMHNLRD
jgi:type III pantothenate kinase